MSEAVASHQAQSNLPEVTQGFEKTLNLFFLSCPIRVVMLVGCCCFCNKAATGSASCTPLVLLTVDEYPGSWQREVTLAVLSCRGFSQQSHSL